MFYKDGRTATVSVRKAEDGGYSLATNGKPDASLSPTWFEPITDTTTLAGLDGDESTQILLPLITLAHAPDAKQGAVIGNGSGMSSHLLLGSPTLEKLVTIDIEPEMINGSHTFYPVNRRVFDDPRSQYVHDDAKSYFAASNRKFDLILSEPSNPWVSGVSGLFTDEFYQRIRTYLTPNGVFGQWLHLYEIDDGLVMSVIKAIHKNFRSYTIFLTAESDILIVASNNTELPKPDWRVFQLPMIAKDLAHFRPMTADVLENARLLSRGAIAPLAGDAQGANSDFYPTLDLLTERTRYMKVVAKGFYELTQGRYDVADALMERRVLPTPEKNSALDIARINSLALGARLRSGEKPDTGSVDDFDKDFREAAERAQTLRDLMAAGHPPADWPIFMRLALSVENDRHNGTMGWTDEPWYASVSHFLDAQHAPADARATLRFMHAIASYDWKHAAAEVAELVKAREGGITWMSEDLFRDGATIAFLHTGDVAKARATFDRMAEFVARKPDDLRVRLVAAHIVAAETQGTEDRGPKTWRRSSGATTTLRFRSSAFGRRYGFTVAFGGCFAKSPTSIELILAGLMYFFIAAFTSATLSAWTIFSKFASNAIVRPVAHLRSELRRERGVARAGLQVLLQPALASLVEFVLCEAILQHAVELLAEGRFEPRDILRIVDRDLLEHAGAVERLRADS